MQAFVTGSTGLLGSNLVRTLRAAGHDVRALARSRQRAEAALGGTGAELVIGDVTDVAGIAEALCGVDVVFHAAAYFREYYAPGDHARRVQRINVDATLELARAAHGRGVSRFIHTGTAGSIGLETDGSPGVEATAPWPGTAGNLYIRSKIEADRRLRVLARETGLFVATALPAWMWGPHDAAPTASGQLVRDALAGSLPPAVPPGGSSVVDARDVAAGMLRMAEAGRSGEQYILSGPYLELGEVMALLATVTGSSPPRLALPYPAAFAMAAAAEAWAAVTKKPSPLSRASMRLMNARLAVSAAKAVRELGVRFRPFEATVRDSVEWARARQHERIATPRPVRAADAPSRTHSPA